MEFFKKLLRKLIVGALMGLKGKLLKFEKFETIVIPFFLLPQWLVRILYFLLTSVNVGTNFPGFWLIEEFKGVSSLFIFISKGVPLPFRRFIVYHEFYEASYYRKLEESVLELLLEKFPRVKSHLEALKAELSLAKKELDSSKFRDYLQWRIEIEPLVKKIKV